MAVSKDSRIEGNTAALWQTGWSPFAAAFICFKHTYYMKDFKNGT
jgi:hypothetical protein